jgi:endonuclease/exonuclease/phosphatase family metal-dependent hydrolase
MSSRLILSTVMAVRNMGLMRTPLSAAYISELPTSLFCLVPAPSAWHRGAGLRIDHRLLSPAIAGKLVDAGVDRHVRGWEKASDHAPAWIAIEELRRRMNTRR